MIYYFAKDNLLLLHLYAKDSPTTAKQNLKKLCLKPYFLNLVSDIKISLTFNFLPFHREKIKKEVFLTDKP